MKKDGRARRSWRKLSKIAALAVASVMACAALLGVPVPALAAANDALNISFSGQFNNQGGGLIYNTAGDEVMVGSLAPVGTPDSAGVTKDEANGVTFTGGEMALHFTAAEQYALGAQSGNATRSFKAELVAKPNGEQSANSTLFSAGGNLFLRYENADTLKFGFASFDGSKWDDHAATAPAPSDSDFHTYQLAYSAANDGTAKLELLIDGQPKGSVSGAQAKLENGLSAKFAIGNEVHPQGNDRGFVGYIKQVRIGNISSAWEYVPEVDRTLVHVDFEGALAGVAAGAAAAAGGSQYQAASEEQLDGTLAFREGTAAPSESAVALQGGTQGLQYEGSELAFSGDTMAVPFIAEARFTPSATDNMTTIIAAGGNIYVRYAGGKLEYGFDYQINGNWASAKQSVSAPAAGTEHVISMAYVPSSTGARMVVYVDDTAQQEVTAAAQAALGSGTHGTLAFGNDVHAQALERGLKGSLDEVRIATTTEAFNQAEFKLHLQLNDCTDVTPANWIDVDSKDSNECIRAKLSALRPTEIQAQYQDLEQIGFIHYGINTYHNQGWGDGTEDPKSFDPKRIDTDQWAKAFADAGFKLVMLTVKHHDGFMLYDSRYTAHDMGSTNYPDMDIVRDFVDSARAYGLKVGFYVSTADSNQEIVGTFGNGKPKQEHTFPEMVANDDRQAAFDAGELETFQANVTDYGAYFLNTLYELLTEYGEISEVWFDGANGHTTKREQYDYEAYYDLIHQLQPKAAIVNSAYDARWVGNEDGVARVAEWSPQATGWASDRGRYYVQPTEQGGEGNDLGSFASVANEVRKGTATRLHWYPAEADGRNSNNWFWTASDTQRDPAKIINMYEKSTGRNAVFLLNVGPNMDGLFEQADLDQLSDFAAEIRSRYATPDLALGKNAVVTVDGEESPAPLLVDGATNTSEATGSALPTYSVELGEEQSFRYLVLGEDSRAAGQQVEQWNLSVREGGTWRQVASGPTIGHRRNVDLGATVRADAVRLAVTAARGPVQISRLEVHDKGASTSAAAQNAPSVYFLDPSAEQAGDGSSKDSPLSSVAQLNTKQLAPGSLLYVKRGSEIEGLLHGFGYGTAAAPVQISYYGGDCESADPVWSLDGFAQRLSTAQMLEATGFDDRGWKYVADPVLPAGASVEKEPLLECPVDPEEPEEPEEPKRVTPEAPASNVVAGAEDPADCDTAPWMQLTATEHVSYTVIVNGVDGTEREVRPQNGRVEYGYGETITVTAVAEEGYTLANGAQKLWSWTAPTREKLGCPVSEKPVTPEGPAELEKGGASSVQGASAQADVRKLSHTGSALGWAGLAALGLAAAGGLLVAGRKRA